MLKGIIRVRHTGTGMRVKNNMGLDFVEGIQTLK